MVRPISFLALFLASNNQFTPTFPFGIIAWIVCNARKRSEIGGWLLFFYWQLFSGMVMTLIFFSINFQSYVPENFGTHPARFYWFLASAVPSIVILFLQFAVATILIWVRTWDLLQLLRWLFVAQVALMIAGIIIDANYFPDDLILGIIMGLIPETAWMAYLFTSNRVRHVFQIHDWDTAVETMYPTPGNLSIS